MTDYTAAPGQTLSGLTLSSGDTLTVSSGGRAVDIAVNSGGSETVLSGGTASGTTLGAQATLSDYGSVSGTSIAGGTMDVFWSATAADTTLLGFETTSTVGDVSYFNSVQGEVNVLQGGTATGLTVGNDGQAYIGGSATGVVIGSGGFATISGWTSGTSVGFGGVEDIGNGGTAYASTVASGGFENVNDAGSAVSAVVSSGGEQTVFSGGASIDTRVSGGGSELVYDGGSNAGGQVSSGGSVTSAAAGGAGHLDIQLSFDGSVASAPAGFVSTVEAVASYLDSLFLTPITVTIDVGWGEVDGAPLGFNLGESEQFDVMDYSYQQIREAMLARTSTAAEIAAAASLPATDPISGATYEVGSAEAEALGLSSGPGVGQAVGAVGFSAETAFTYGTTNAVSASTWDLFGVVEHEMTEVLGRTASGGAVDGTGVYTPFDLFRYTAPGVRALTPGTSFFSVNGTALLGQLNDWSANGGDVGDWAASVAGDSFDSSSVEGVLNPLSPTDLTLMDVLGYTPAGTVTVSSTVGISGIVADQFIARDSSVNPFSGVTVTDQTAPDEENVTLMQSDPTAGTLSNLGAFTWQSGLDGYTAYGTPAQITSALDGLVFTPNTDPTATGSVTLTLGLNDSAGDSANALVTLGIACFREGTAIDTPNGPVAVERLRAGDPVLTADGSAKPVVWIGERRIDCRRHARPPAVWPVRVRADAFGTGHPRQDLWLSPDHAVFAGGVLIPVKVLIDGRAIEQEPVAEVRYFHLELACHDVVLADGLAVESYLDTGDRACFANGGGVEALHPEFGALVRETAGFAPVCVTGAIVDAVRTRLRQWKPASSRAA